MFGSYLPLSWDPVISTAISLESRLRKCNYIPLATEAHGIYEIVLGSYLMGMGYKSRIAKSCSGTDSECVNLISNFHIQSGKLLIGDGIGNLFSLPSTTLKGTYNLAARSAKILHSASTNQKDN